jgi:plasmid recombination enzyme
MYIVEKNFGSKCEVKQKAYEQSVAHYTSQAKLWALRGCESTNKTVRRGNSTHFAQRLQKTNFRRKIIISYLVCHMEKYHKQDVAPIEKENERDENYEASNPQIDSERTRNNYRFTPYFGKTYTEFINGRIKELGLSPRKDAVVMNSFVVGSDKQFFDGLSKVERYNFFSDCYKFFAERYGEENVIAAVVHNDETTPHMHLNLMPVTKDGRLCSKQLFDKPQLQQLQTDFYEAVGKKYGLERGEEGSQKKHLSTAEFKAKKIIEQAEAIREENQVYADAITEAKSGNIPRKRGKLQEQVIALTANNADLSKRLTKSMDEALLYAQKSEALQKEKENNSHYTNVGKELARTNPTEYRRIVHGKPKTIGSFFDSVLSLFTPDVVRQVPRLQQIEAEIEEERKKQEKQSKNNNHK